MLNIAFEPQGFATVYHNNKIAAVIRVEDGAIQIVYTAYVLSSEQWDEVTRKVKIR